MFSQETLARRLTLQAGSAGDRLIKSVLYSIPSRAVVFYELTSDELKRKKEIFELARRLTLRISDESAG